MGEAFSVKLKKLRTARHITQQGMAKILNVSRSCVANYESDRRQPDTESLVAIADYFHVSIDYLMGRSGSVRETAYGERQKKLEALGEKAESKQKLDLRMMDTESKLLLLKFYSYLSAMQE